MNGSLPALDALLAYESAGEDPFDFELFDVMARESSPPSLASWDQAPPLLPGRRSALLVVLWWASHDASCISGLYLGWQF